MAKLTKSFVDSRPIPTDGKPKIEWDERVRGFGLRIMPSGKKSYFVQGRVSGKSIKKNIGVHGVFTPDEALEAAKDMLRDMSKGVDVREVEKAKAAEVAAQASLRTVADGYLRDRALKESTRRGIERHVTKTFSAWTQKPLVSITGEMVTNRFNEFKAKGLHGNAPAPAQATQAFGVLRALFNYAAREYRRADGSPLIPYNPTDVLYKKWVVSPPRKRRIPNDKVGAVWNALWEWRKTPFNSDTLTSIDFCIFMLCTGTRRGEAGALRWSEVDLDKGSFHLSNPKNGISITLPMASQVIELLTTRFDSKINEYVFNTCAKEGHIGDPRAIMERISKMADAVVSPHDLRRTFTNISINCCNVPLYRTELLTNHIPKSITERHYLETDNLMHLAPDTQRVADWIVEQSRLSASTASKS